MYILRQEWIVVCLSFILVLKGPQHRIFKPELRIVCRHPTASWHNLSAFGAIENLYLNFLYCSWNVQQFGHRWVTQWSAFCVVDACGICVVSFLHVHFSGQPNIVPTGIIWFLLLLSHEWKNSRHNATVIPFMPHWMPERAELNVWHDAHIVSKCFGADTAEAPYLLVCQNAKPCQNSGRCQWFEIQISRWNVHLEPSFFCA